jgi:TonB family protein
MRSFKQSFLASVGLHAAVVALVIFAVNYQPRPIHLPAVNPELAHAIAVSLAPLRRLQPKPQQKPVPHVTPKPQPPTVSSTATEAVEQTPPPAQKPSPPTNPPEDQPEQRQATYQEIAEAILEANKRYPREALISGTEGEVTFSYIVNRQGTVLAYTIEQSSGSYILDDEVKRLIRSVRFPPFPPGDNDERKSLEVTIEFSLKN